MLMNHEHIQFVLNVKKVYDNGEYHLYLQLYKSAPPLFKRIMKLVIEKVRYRLTRILFSVLRPSVTEQDFKEYMQFETEGEYRDFVTKYPLVFDNKGNILCESSVISLLNHHQQ